MNGRLKRTFNHATQKGGSSSKGKLLPMVLTFVRSSLQQCGALYDFFENLAPSPELGVNIMYRDIPNNHYDHKIDDDVIGAFAETILGFGRHEDIYGEFTADNVNVLFGTGDGKMARVCDYENNEECVQTVQFMVTLIDWM